MTAEELITSIRAQLVAQADPKFREVAVGFSREPIDPYGVRAPQVRRIAVEAYRELKGWPRAQIDRLCEELWKSGKFEEGAVAVVVYQRFGVQFGATEFRLFEKWVDRHVRNWGHCDAVACLLIAACLQNEPALIGRLRQWTASKNRWKRRAAAVSLVPEARRGGSTPAILEIAGRLLADQDEMVQKGAGWLLKDAYPKRPRDIVRFLLSRGACASRLLLRIATDKMPAADRRRVLGGGSSVRWSDQRAGVQL
jgi:3-methyladenine DNA glycosylase AlkD